MPQHHQNPTQHTDAPDQQQQHRQRAFPVQTKIVLQTDCLHIFEGEGYTERTCHKNQQQVKYSAEQFFHYLSKITVGAWLIVTANIRISPDSAMLHQLANEVLDLV